MFLLFHPQVGTSNTRRTTCPAARGRVATMCQAQQGCKRYAIARRGMPWALSAHRSLPIRYGKPMRPLLRNHAVPALISPCRRPFASGETTGLAPGTTRPIPRTPDPEVRIDQRTGRPDCRHISERPARYPTPCTLGGDPSLSRAQPNGGLVPREAIAAEAAAPPAQTQSRPSMNGSGSP